MTTYTEISATYENGRTAGTTDTCRTTARTGAGIAAALHRTIGPSAVSMGGSRIASISAYNRADGRTVEFTV